MLHVKLHLVSAETTHFFVAFLSYTLGFGDRSILSNCFLQLLDLIEESGNRSREYYLEGVTI